MNKIMDTKKRCRPGKDDNFNQGVLTKNPKRDLNCKNPKKEF